MASRKRDLRLRGTVRLDDPEVAMELACQYERANWLASRTGLPTIGSRMVNKYGIEWVVQNHTAVPTYDTLHRWRQGEVEPSDDLYPVIAPQNLSPKLTEFIATIDRCTTKTFAILDTMPGRRKDGHVPGGNSIDTLCHPMTNLLFLDAARVCETVVAHEFGHAWVQYVDECEDLRAMEDASDPQRMRLVGFVQSFVQDLKVNDLLRRKGFDMAPIEEDQAATMAQLATALQSGYEPEHAKEEVFMALLVADELIQRERGSDALVRIDGCLAKIQSLRPPMTKLAERLAGTVAKHGYGSRESVIACTDECLLAAFEHAGERIDLDRDLVLVNPEEPNLDKFPDWLSPLSPRSKCQAGKHMARNEVSSDWAWSLNTTVAGRARVTFSSPEGDRRSEFVLHESFGPPTRYSHLPDTVAEQLAWKHRNQTGSFQLFGGPPHKVPSVSNLEPEEIMRMNEMNRGNLGQVSGKLHPIPSVVHRIPGRPYMAGLGRFLTAARLRDQIAGEHPYGYALNNPVTYTDPSGLNPMRCSVDCDDACKKFIAANPKWCAAPPSPPYPPGSKAYAFAFCCNGKPNLCYCPGYGPSPNPYIKACIEVHEHGHIPPGGCASGFTGPPPKWYNECTALKAGIKCANEQCRHTVSNDCIELAEWKCTECRRLKYACKPMPPESWLRQYCKDCGV